MCNADVRHWTSIINNKILCEVDYIIIVAGGKGLRMGGDLPKQFLPIAGKPVLMHTIERFYKYNHESSKTIGANSVPSTISKSIIR